jgi:hypothetical protein
MVQAAPSFFIVPKYHERLLPAGTRIKALIGISNGNLERVKRFMTLSSRDGVVVSARCFEPKKETTYNVLVLDDRCAMLTWKERTEDDLVAFWTNAEVLIEVWREYFEKMWDEAADISRKLRRIEGHIRTQRP